MASANSLCSTESSRQPNTREAITGRAGGQWQTLYDQTYRQTAPDPTFNIVAGTAATQVSRSRQSKASGSMTELSEF